MSSLRVVTYNIRKGKGASGRRSHRVAELADALRDRQADLVLCQEVFHARSGLASQSDELGETLGMRPFYRPNKMRRVGHHGNATFSHLPALHVENFDMTVGRVEKRGALYVRLDVGGQPLHVFNVHLSLRHRHRVQQIRRLQRIIRHLVPDSEPVLLAGDFNDWPGRLDGIVVDELGFANAFADHGAVCTWPAGRPLFNLDRVYVKNLTARRGERLVGGAWSELSDHLPLQIDLSA